MNIAILLTAAALVATKFLDCWTTLKFVDASTETHPLARGWMGRFGVRGTVWGVFGISLTTIALFLWIALTVESELVRGCYVLCGLFVAGVQAAVAHTNATGRWNRATRVVARVHGRVARGLRG